MFNEWLDEAHHCVSHFRPFLKVDVFYWTPEMFRPSPWFKMPSQVFLDRDGLVRATLADSESLSFPPPSGAEVSRVLSKALAGTHEVVRRARRGELVFAQSLLDELRLNMVRLDTWLLGFEPSLPQDLKHPGRISAPLVSVLDRSYAGLNAADIDRAVVELAAALANQIPELHEKFELKRPREMDLLAVSLVIDRQVA